MRSILLFFRRTSVVIALLVLTSLVLISLDRQLTVNPLREVAATVLRPAQASSNRTGEVVGGFFASFGDVQELRRENESLRRLIDSLTAENVQVQSLRRENERLRQQLEFKQLRPELQQLPAEVITRDPTSLRKYIVIDRGRRDGVEPGMAVISPAGLVGRVQTVEERRARVLLLIDSHSAVRALVQDSHVEGRTDSRADGIVYGLWPRGRLRIRYVDTTAQIKEGTWVLTSGLDDELPRDLPIGWIQKVYKADVLENQEADLVPAVDPDALDSVTVILRSG